MIEAEQLKRIENSDDPKAAAFNLGYDHGWEGRQIEEGLLGILGHWYHSGWQLGDAHREERAREGL